MGNTGIFLYQQDGNYHSYFLNFYQKIDFHEVLKLLPDNKPINIEKAFIETGLGQSYEAYEEEDLGIVSTVLDLKNRLYSLSKESEEPFIQKLNFWLESNVFFHVFEDSDIEIKFQNEEGEIIVKKILSLLFRDEDKIDKLIREAKRHRGKYIEAYFNGEIKKVHDNFDSYLISQNT